MRFIPRICVICGCPGAAILIGRTPVARPVDPRRRGGMALAALALLARLAGCAQAPVDPPPLAGAGARLDPARAVRPA